MSADVESKRNIEHQDPDAKKKPKNADQETQNNVAHLVHAGAQSADLVAERNSAKPILFWGTHTCATVVIQVLIELGVLDQWTLAQKSIKAGETKTEEFVSMNPLGCVRNH